MLSFGRRQSQRCPDKLLRPFAETTLADVILTKLRAFAPDAFFAAHDAEFKAKAAAHGVTFVQRSERSVTIDEPVAEVLGFLRDVPYTHLLIVNACLPFLRVSTIRRFLSQTVENGHQPAFAVLRRHTHFLDLDGRPLNFPSDLKTINTKTVQPVYEFAHALYFFERDYLFEHGRYWDWSQLHLEEITNRHEAIDIDTEEDFALAEALWRGGFRP